MNSAWIAMTFTFASAAFAHDLPIPPIPPERSPFGETAPVPNFDAVVPIAPVSNAPTVMIKQFRAQPYGPGLGFAPGSRYESAEDRKPIQTPGLTVSVPLQ
jgi:hypothetical protein